MYQLEGQDCSGDTKQFQKPWLQTALMFIAMAFCLPIGWGIEAWQKKHPKKQRKTSSGSHDNGDGDSSAQQPLLSEHDQQQPPPEPRFNLKEALLLCIPTGFDLAATTLMNVGLLYVAASGRRRRHGPTSSCCFCSYRLCTLHQFSCCKKAAAYTYACTLES